nr:hypothetical protein TetV2_00106 [Oceanusvirus sp.]
MLFIVSFVFNAIFGTSTEESFNDGAGAPGGDSTGNLGLFQVNPTVIYNEANERTSKIVDYVFLAIDIAVLVAAMFFYFRRNRHKFDIRGFLAALLCAYFYIAYALAVPVASAVAVN